MHVSLFIVQESHGTFPREKGKEKKEMDSEGFFLKAKHVALKLWAFF
jgi:hypothetical protein